MNYSFKHHTWMIGGKYGLYFEKTCLNESLNNLYDVVLLFFQFFLIVSVPSPSASVATKTCWSLCFFMRLRIFFTAPLRLGTSSLCPQMKSFLRKWTPQVRASLSTAQPVLVQEFTKGHATNMTALSHWNERGCKVHGIHSRNALYWHVNKSSDETQIILFHKHQFDIYLIVYLLCWQQWHQFEQWEERINASETYFHSGPVFVVRRLVLFVCGVEILGPKLVSYDTQVFGKHHTSPCL